MDYPTGLTGRRRFRRGARAAFYTAVVAVWSLQMECGGSAAKADEPAAGAAKGDESGAVAAAASDEALRRWVDALGDASHAVRAKAQRELAQAGETALKHVAEAADSANPEIRARGIEILRRHAAGADAPLAAKAQALLGELSGSADLGVARAAETALATNARRKADELLAQQYAEAGMFLRGRGGVIRVRPAIVARAGVAKRIALDRSVSISVINGKRTIVAEEGGQRVEISDGGDDGIKMTIVKKVDGKEKKEAFAAKDAKELKEKHPDAFKEYEKYAKDGGGAVIRAEVVEARRDAQIREAEERIRELRARLEAKEKAAREGNSEKKPGEAPPADKAAASKPGAAAPKLPPVNHVDVPAVTPQR